MLLEMISFGWKMAKWYTNSTLVLLVLLSYTTHHTEEHRDITYVVAWTEIWLGNGLQFLCLHKTRWKRNKDISIYYSMHKCIQIYFNYSDVN